MTWVGVGSTPRAARFSPTAVGHLSTASSAGTGGLTGPDELTVPSIKTSATVQYCSECCIEQVLH